MLENLDWETTVEASDATISTAVDDETVLLDLDTDMYYSVNSVGAEIWADIQEPTQLQMLREMLTETYDLSTAEAEADLVAFLESLTEAGLIECRDD
jgi:hypothetical protein